MANLAWHLDFGTNKYKFENYSDVFVWLLKYNKQIRRLSDIDIVPQEGNYMEIYFIDHYTIGLFPEYKKTFIGYLYKYEQNIQKIYSSW